MEEAKRLGCERVDTDHILYGCTKLRDGTSLALLKNTITRDRVQVCFSCVWRSSGVVHAQTRPYMDTTQQTRFGATGAGAAVCLFVEWLALFWRTGAPLWWALQQEGSL
jgi:hypothetical protein